MIALSCDAGQIGGQCYGRNQHLEGLNMRIDRDTRIAGYIASTADGYVAAGRTEDEARKRAGDIGSADVDIQSATWQSLTISVCRRRRSASSPVPPRGGESTHPSRLRGCGIARTGASTRWPRTRIYLAGGTR